MLPQQPPFLFLDEAEIDGDRVTAHYLIRGDESLLKGHFRDDPVFPGSIIFEAIGQAGCLWIKNHLGELDQSKLLFVMMDGARCYRRCVPGDRLEMEITKTQLRAPLATFSGRIHVGSEKVAVVWKFRLAFGVDAP